MNILEKIDKHLSEAKFTLKDSEKKAIIKMIENSMKKNPQIIDYEGVVAVWDAGLEAYNYD